jgi:hypothetical protein
MIDTSSAYGTAKDQLAQEPIYLIEIDGYPYTFATRDPGFAPEPDAIDYQVVEGPFESATVFGPLSYWEEATKTLFWVGLKETISLGGGVIETHITIYSIKDGLASFHEVSGLPNITNGSIGRNLYADDENFYLDYGNGPGYNGYLRISRLDYSFQAWMGGLGVFGGPFINPIGMALPVAIAGVKRLVVVGARQADLGGHVLHLYEIETMTPLEDLDIHGTQYPYICADTDGIVWAANVTTGTVWVNSIDWTAGVPGVVASYDTGIAATGVTGMIFSEEAGALIISTATKVFRWDTDTHAVTGAAITPTSQWAGMTLQASGDGTIIIGINKLDPVAWTIASDLDITGFGIPAGFSDLSGNTFAFGRAYDSDRDIFYAMDKDGNVWGLRVAFNPGSIIRDWIVDISDLKLTINDLDGSSALGDLTFRVQDRDHLVTADFPGFVFEGKVTRLRGGYPGLLRSEYVTLFTGRMSVVSSANRNNEYEFSCRRRQGAPELASDFGPPPTTAHRPTATITRTITANPMDLLISILEPTAYLPGFGGRPRDDPEVPRPTVFRRDGEL